MYAVIFPVNYLRTLISEKWNLGEVCFTFGVMRAVEEQGLSTETLLQRHFAGDYGLINEDDVDLCRNRASRIAGRPFTSCFMHGDDMVKVVTNPQRCCTVVCLAKED